MRNGFESFCGLPDARNCYCGAFQKHESPAIKPGVRELSWIENQPKISNVFSCQAFPARTWEPWTYLRVLDKAAWPARRPTL
jgi:hypothetical protein